MPPGSISHVLPTADRDYLARVAALRAQPSTGAPASSLRIPTQEAINIYFKGIVDTWEPHPFTTQERETIRKEGLRFLILSLEIERVQRDVDPRRLPPEVEAQLSFAKQSYILRYFRLFRVNSLPPEVLNNILRFVIWDSRRTPVRARLTVTWVCKLWREIAIDDVTIWTAVWYRPGAARIQRASTWLERTRQASLDIRIDVVDHVDETLTIPPDDLRKILTCIFEKRQTIRMLIVTVASDDWESALIVLELLALYGPHGLPMLQRFELHRGGLNNEDRKSLAWPPMVPQPFLGGAKAPLLSYISLNGVPIDWRGSILENLTTFDMRRLPSIYRPDLARFYEILTNCPRLIKLSLDGAGPRFDEVNMDQPLTPVDLPCLRTLVVADLTRAYAIFLFSAFTARNVNDLTLMNLCGDDYSPLFQLMTGMFPRVQLLTAYSLQYEPHGPPIMVRWLDAMPMLAYMRVANLAPYFYGLFFRDGDLQNPVAPHLQVLDCQVIEPPILVQWAKDRAHFGTPLKKIYVSEELGSQLHESHLRELTSLCVVARLPKGATTPEEEVLNGVQ
ncbi:hypothetical protein C8F01DRAFT_1013487 [Mycena amicta]|nr:hypothetical protein C8F01DRAFT_1013487 [Mycena amicta]